MNKVMRRELFGAEIKSRPAIIENFCLKESRDFYFVTPENNSSVEGEIIWITDDQLLLADQWEEIPFYSRIMVVVKTGKQTVNAWTYTRFDREGSAVVRNKASTISHEEVLRMIVAFNKQLSRNNLPYSDAYLMVPCLIDMNLFTPDDCTGKTCFEQTFLDKLQSTCNTEFSGTLADQINRQFLPVIEIAVDSTDEPGKLESQKASVIISHFKVSNYAVMNIIIPAISAPLLDLLDQVSSDRIQVRSLGGEQFIALSDYFKSLGVIVNGSTRVALFMKSRPTDEHFLLALICEPESPAKVSGRALTSIINDNIAQYDSADIFASDICIIEIPRQFNLNYEQRLNSQVLTLFIIELIQLQESAINKVCDDINTMISKKMYLSDQVALKQIQSVTEEYAKAMLLWDINNFRYRTAQNLANEFSRKFKMEQKFEVFFQYKHIMEQLTQVHSNRINISENKLLNSILLMLAFVQIVPVLYSAMNSLIASSIRITDIISGATSIVSCLMIWIIFRLINKKQQLEL